MLCLVAILFFLHPKWFHTGPLSFPSRSSVTQWRRPTPGCVCPASWETLASCRSRRTFWKWRLMWVPWHHAPAVLLWNWYCSLFWVCHSLCSCGTETIIHPAIRRIECACRFFEHLLDRNYLCKGPKYSWTKYLKQMINLMIKCQKCLVD